MIVVVIAIRVAAGARRRSRPGYFSERYRARTAPGNVSWSVLRVVTFTLTLGRDVLVPILPAQTLDHLVYGRLGREWPLRDVVPLSRATHGFVTSARDVVGRGPVNLVLRAAFVVWLSLDYELVALAANLAGVRWITVPIPLATIVAAASAAGTAASAAGTAAARWLSLHLVGR